MFTLYRYKKNGLPSGLIKLHEFLLEDIILHFERAKFIRKRVKRVHKTIKQALRFAKHKKVYPSKKTDLALELMKELHDEVDRTQKVLRETAAEMERLISHIKEERVMKIFSLIRNAREHFREQEFEKGMELFKEAQNELGKKALMETRNNVLAGIDSEIKKIKHEIEKKRKNNASRNKLGDLKAVSRHS